MPEAADLKKDRADKTEDAARTLTRLVAIQRRQYQDAIPPFLESIRLRPKNARAYHNLGAAYMNLRQYDDAIVAYNQALSVEPAYAQAYKVHREIGSVYIRTGRSTEAIQPLKRSIELNPRYATAHWELGSAYHFLARYSEAVESLSKAAQLEPQTANIHTALGDAYQHLGRAAEAEKIP
jgi:superkiller protein 3